MRKFLSLFLTATMVSALFTAPTFAQSNGISISGINADPEAIYIYYTQGIDDGVDVANLKDACSIIINGVDVADECTYEKAELLESNGGGINKKYFRGCTVIKRNNGAEFPINSEISFKANVLDGVMTKAFSKNFTIYELVNDDFSGELNWKTAESNKSNPTIAEYTINDAADEGLLMPKDTPVVNVNSDKQADWTDYTLTFDIYQSVDFVGPFDVYYTESSNVGYELQLTHARLRGYSDNNWKHTGADIKPETGKLTKYKFSSDVGGGVTRAVASRNGKIFIDYAIDRTATGIPTLRSRGGEGVYVDNLRITKMISNDADVEVSFDIENADADGITIYPQVDGKAVVFEAEELSKFVELRNDTDEVDIPVKVETVKNTTGKYSNACIKDTPYIVKRVDGKDLEADKDYTFTVNQGPITTSFVALNKPFVKKFRLTKVFSDDFSGVDDNSSVDNMKMKLVAENSAHEIGIQNEELIVNIPSGENKLVPIDYKEMLDLKDCTVRFDVKALEFTGTDGVVVTNRKMVPLFVNNEEATYDDSHANFEVQNTNFRIRVNNCLVYNSNTGTYESSKWHGDYTYDNSELTCEAKETYKFSGNGLKYSFYRNGRRLAAISESEEKYAAKGAFALRMFNTKLAIDNVIVTKMELIPEDINISGAVITADGAEVNSVAGKTAADISVKVRNTFVTDKKAAVVVAVYKANGDMTNVVCENNVILAQGNNSLSFENVAINGGEKIKVFVFEDLENLNPYCKSLEK